MSRFYSETQLSDNISVTPEGFLLCRNVAITKAGVFLYTPAESPLIPPNPDGSPTVIYRSVADITDPDTIASFEGKSVTVTHPDEFVCPLTWKQVTVGVVHNVRAGTGDDFDKLFADLLVTDFEAIQLVQSGRLREVSWAIEAEWEVLGPGEGRHRDILGNHVALVRNGRAGSDCAIIDHETISRESDPMKNPSLTDRIKSRLGALLGQAVDEAIQEAGTAVAAATDADPAPAADADPVPEEGDPAAEGDPPTPAAADAEGDPAPAGEDPAAEQAEAVTMETLGTKVDGLVAGITKLIQLLTPAEPAPTPAAPAATDAQPDNLCTDADTLALAEILAPGIAPTADVKAKALAFAMATDEGRAIVTQLLGGKAMDAADQDQLFLAAAQLTRANRRAALGAATAAALDSAPRPSGPMTPERINELNAAHYGTTH